MQVKVLSAAACAVAFRMAAASRALGANSAAIPTQPGDRGRRDERTADEVSRASAQSQVQNMIFLTKFLEILRILRMEMATEGFHCRITATTPARLKGLSDDTRRCCSRSILKQNVLQAHIRSQLRVTTSRLMKLS
jgi:hypothetical protein